MQAAEPSLALRVKGVVKTETDQAAPNGFTVQLLRKGTEVLASGFPDRMTGAFALTAQGCKAGEELTLLVKDPMMKPVTFQTGYGKPLAVDAKTLGAGLIDAGIQRVELPAQEPTEAFAFGGRVFDRQGKPVPEGYAMHVTAAKGERKTSEDIREGKFALIFIDLQGEFPRIGEGDSFRFEVKNKEGKVFAVKPEGYKLTRTDIANSSIATLEFKVELP
ncbi:MAG: hypothetical protein HY814_12840 [Candidatus Riflebacteria bacterium]|nr:hypothetical protein [Candidatus Riflebacteria bacterium]